MLEQFLLEEMNINFLKFLIFNYYLNAEYATKIICQHNLLISNYFLFRNNINFFK